ncbi:MAG: membrane protein insertion efficiency factor YidD [Burkholderiaceae bacterium]|nr:membrane protein insertion efficiency factor YidD [Burkholderiaceae bacterium]
MRQIAIALIRGYKRFLSPAKGFNCAYRVYCGRASCSTFGIRAIRRFGTYRGIGLLSSPRVLLREDSPVVLRPSQRSCANTANSCT